MQRNIDYVAVPGGAGGNRLYFRSGKREVAVTVIPAASTLTALYRVQGRDLNVITPKDLQDVEFNIIDAVNGRTQEELEITPPIRNKIRRIICEEIKSRSAEEGRFEDIDADQWE